MADTWSPETAQVPLGEVLFGPEVLDDSEFEIVDAEQELAAVPLTMELNDDQRAMIRFLDGLDWSGLTIERKRVYYERVLGDVIKKRSSRRY